MMTERTSMPLANLQKRIASFVIDDIVVALLLLAIFYNQLTELASYIPSVITPESIEIFKTHMNQFSVQNVLLIVALKILYHGLLIWQNGMTMGKYLMKIRVVEVENNQKPTLFKAFLRAVLRVGSEMTFYLGFVLAFFLPLKQTLHDKLSGCIVIDA